MKILWCIVLYLVFNDFLAIASKLQNENEETNILMNLMQSMEALEKLFDKNLQIQDKKIGALEKLVEEIKVSDASSLEQNQQNFEALKKLIENKDKLFEESNEMNNKRFGDLEKFHEESVERDDCGKQCAKDDSCTSVFWSNSTDSKCRFNQDKSTLVKFVPGELYYCKDCQSNLDLVFEAEHSGVIRLANVAKNKPTQASSFVNAMSDSSKAVDGDPNTWFSSEALLPKGEPWLMVDLGQRFLVAQIRIQVRTKPIHKISGGYFQVCLVDDFDRNTNTCNQHSNILEVNRRLRGYSKLFDVKKVIMGRYVVIKKMKEDTLEIAELEVLSVIPIMSYECTSCLEESNTVCEESRIPPVCSCAENHLPVDGDARNGCKDPCLDFNEANAVCDRVDHETQRCSCNAGFHPVRGDACNGCNDPSIGFKDRNTICRAVSYEEHSCECKNGHFEIFKEEPCFGCLNPCVSFIGLHSTCSAVDANRYECSCKQGFRPMHGNEPCHGCKRNVCPSSLGYKNYKDFGCLKAHKTLKTWEDARSSCISEGGDLFSPGHKHPLLPKDEMNLGSIWYWIGARSNGRNGPFERVNSGEKLADDSQLWDSGQPSRGSEECVCYYEKKRLLHDCACTLKLSFICEI